MDESEARGLIAGALGDRAGRAAVLGTRRRGAIAEVVLFRLDGRALVLRRRLAGVGFGYEAGLAKEAIAAAAWAARSQGAEAVAAAMAAARARPRPGRLPQGPELLAAGHGARPWSIQQALTGPALGERPDPDAFRRLGALLADLHALPLPGCLESFHDLPGRPVDPEALYRRELGRALEAASQAAALAPSLAADLRRLGEALAPALAGARAALCHNDLHGLNVLVAPELPVGLGLIDWDNAALRPAALDLVKLRHWCLVDEAGFLAPAAALYAAFREGYDSARGEVADARQLQAFELLWLLRVLAFEAAREAAGRVPAPPFPAASGYRRRLEALAGEGRWET